MKSKTTTINLIVLLIATAVVAAVMYWLPPSPADTAPSHRLLRNNATNTTKIYDTVTWSVELSDEALSGYYSIHNGTGTFTNTPYIQLEQNPTSFTANVTLNITQPRGNNICLQFLFNDSAGKVNRTELNASCITVANTPPSQPKISFPKNQKSYPRVNYLNFTSSDADNDSLTYAVYFQNMLFTTTQQSFLELTLSEGMYDLKIIVNDSSATSESTIHFTIEKPSPNKPLEVYWMLLGWIFVLAIIATEQIVKNHREKKHTGKYEKL